MDCPVCQQLIIEFADATTSYSVAVDHMAQVAGLGRKPTFVEAHKWARQEFDKCSRAHDALERHRSTSHGSRNKPKSATGPPAPSQIRAIQNITPVP